MKESKIFDNMSVGQILEYLPINLTVDNVRYEWRMNVKPKSTQFGKKFWVEFYYTSHIRSYNSPSNCLYYYDGWGVENTLRIVARHIKGRYMI